MKCVLYNLNIEKDKFLNLFKQNDFFFINFLNIDKDFVKMLVNPRRIDVFKKISEELLK